MVTLYKTELDYRHLPVLVQERSITYEGAERSRLRSPDDVYRLLVDGLRHDRETEEIMYMLCTDASGRVVGVFEIAHGGSSFAHIEISSCMKKALLSGAHGVIFAHNHPSGDPSESREDIEINKRLKAACELLQIRYDDFLIIGDGCFESFRSLEII